MRSLLISTYAHTGGAAVACQRVADALQMQGVEAAVMCTSDYGVRKSLERLRLLPHVSYSLAQSWRVDPGFCGIDVTQTKAFQEADVIHLHWTNQGMLSLRSLDRLLKSGKPVLLTMHDMWYCTSLCHHAGDCKGYLHACGNCPLLSRPAEDDLSRQVFLQKQRIYAQGRFEVTAVSQWLKEKAQQSTLLREKVVQVVPNLLPEGVFGVGDKSRIRQELGVPQGRPIIVFSASRIDDANKDFPLFLEAMRRVSGAFVLLVGEIKDKRLRENLEIPHKYFGRVVDMYQLARIYSAADICVSTSFYETFGQTLAEAQACGCIPVSFSEGGQADIITHKQTGYLVENHTAEAMAEGIRWTIDNQQSISATALQQSAKRFSATTVAQQYIKIYESLTH